MLGWLESAAVSEISLHDLLDRHYGHDGADVLRRRLAAGESTERRCGPHDETPLHVAARRRRRDAVEILLDHGAAIDARTRGGKTAFAHCARRGFDEIAGLLESRGAETSLSAADRFAVAVVQGRLDDARAIAAEGPDVARTGNPEEDRLLADVAGRNAGAPVELLIAAGADLTAPGLDGGTPLHQAAWFGQPVNARKLIDAGAPLDVFDPVHQSSPVGWAVHGSRYSGGADARQPVYVELVRMLLDAGSLVHYPDDPTGDAYRRRLLEDATPAVRPLLESRG